MKAFFKIENLVFVFFFALGGVLITLSSNRQQEVFFNSKSVVLTAQLRLAQGVKGLADFLKGFGGLLVIQQQKKALEAELIYYRGIDRENVVVKNENARLRELLAMTPRLQFRFQSASIVARSPDNSQSLLVLDKGSIHGIVPNMSVVAYSPKEAIFALVGRISDVSDYGSRVIPLYDRSQYVAARLENSRFLGLVNGLGQNQFAQLDYVDLTAEKEIRSNDLVVTSGLNSVSLGGLEYASYYPEGLYIGRIKELKESKTLGVSLSYQLKGIVNFDQLENVFIITDQMAYQATPNIITRETPNMNNPFVGQVSF